MLLVVVDDASHADLESLQAVVSAVVRLRDSRVMLILARTTGWPPTGMPQTDEVLDRFAASHVSIPALDADQDDVPLLAESGGVVFCAVDQLVGTSCAA